MARSEFWAPLWEYPANLTEIRALLERGLARVGQRPAERSHEFAIAAITTGVDAGVKSFARFVLRQTTSSQVYEAIPLQRIAVQERATLEASLLAPLIPWMDRLPREPTSSKYRGQFKGFRGPVAEAIVAVAEKPDQAERWQELLLILADVQTRIDRNKQLRGSCEPLPFLDVGWFQKAWPRPTLEVLVAEAIASVGSGSGTPLLVNVFGVSLDEHGLLSFSGEQRPQRAVWYPGEPARVLADLLERRLVDTGPTGPPPVGGAIRCDRGLVADFLAGRLDLELVTKWVPPLCMLRWKPAGQSLRSVVSSSRSGAYVLHSLFRPLFHDGELHVGGERLFPKGTSSAVARRLLNLIRQQDWEEAARFAESRYLAAGRATVRLTPGAQAEGDRIAASLLIPMRSSDVRRGVEQWLLPSKERK